MLYAILNNLQLHFFCLVRHGACHRVSVLSGTTDAKMSSIIVSRHRWIAVLSKITTLVFCVFTDSKYRTLLAEVQSVEPVLSSFLITLFYIVFFYLVLRDFCIICKSLKLFWPKALYTYLFSAVTKCLACMYMIKFMTSRTSLISKHYVEKQKILMQLGCRLVHLVTIFYCISTPNTVKKTALQSTL